MSKLSPICRLFACIAVAAGRFFQTPLLLMLTITVVFSHSAAHANCDSLSDLESNYSSYSTPTAFYNAKKGNFCPPRNLDAKDFVAGVYFHVLKRPDDAGATWWSNYINTNDKICDAFAAAFISAMGSTDASNFNAFPNTAIVESLYRGFLGRKGRTAGVNWWEGKLSQEVSNEGGNKKTALSNIIYAFLDAPEFQLRCDSFGVRPYDVPQSVNRSVSAAGSAAQEVKSKASILLSNGLNAGSIYSVWIRDLATFIESSGLAGSDAKDALVTFLQGQGTDGNIDDNYTVSGGSISYGKNTVETDQESSMVQAVFAYIKLYGDPTILDVVVNGKTVENRLDLALNYLFNYKFDSTNGLIWGATTADWGDVQVGDNPGVDINASTVKAIDIYDNAMAVIAIRQFLEMSNINRSTHESRLATLIDKIEANLWESNNNRYIPHIFLQTAPFSSSVEASMYFHGGTIVAIQAGLMSHSRISTALSKMKANVTAVGGGTIGLTLYPVYPAGTFTNPIMDQVYEYQNGGDWTWFGGRMIHALAVTGFGNDAYDQLLPMLNRVKDEGYLFYEWWDPRYGTPFGSGDFKGSAGVLYKAINTLEKY